VTLSLPEGLSVFADSVAIMHRPSVYALTLSRPDDLAAAWDRTFDTRPPWFESFRDAGQAIYVGAASDTLARLEDHRDGDVRVATLMQVCDIDGLRNVWWFDDADRAFERESGIATTLANEYTDAYVHQR